MIDILILDTYTHILHTDFRFTRDDFLPLMSSALSPLGVLNEFRRPGADAANWRQGSNLKKLLAVLEASSIIRCTADKAPVTAIPVMLKVPQENKYIVTTHSSA